MNHNHPSETLSPGDIPTSSAGRHPRLLVSVRNSREAAVAASGGVDWIDLKEPTRGPLGAVDAATACEVAEQVAGAYPLSAAGGELLDWTADSADGHAARRLATVPGIRLIKLGLAGCQDYADWQHRWQAAQTEIARSGKQLVAACYADWQTARAPHPAEVVDLAIDSHCRFLLFDTFDKSQKGILNHLPLEQLAKLLTPLQNKPILAVLAGSITREMLPRLTALPVGIIAVRGAVCSGGRCREIRQELVEQLCRAIEQCDWTFPTIHDASPAIATIAKPTGCENT